MGEKDLLIYQLLDDLGYHDEEESFTINGIKYLVRILEFQERYYILFSNSKGDTWWDGNVDTREELEKILKENYSNMLYKS